MESETRIDPSELPQIPGFDLEPPLRLMRGRWCRLQKLLLNFTENYREANGQLRSMIEEGQWQQAQSFLHDIIGGGGNLGATAIVKVSAKLESQIKNGKRTLTKDLLDEFAHCVGQLAEAECILHALDSDENDSEKISNQYTSKVANIKDIEECLRCIEAHLQTDVGRAENEIDLLMTHCRGSNMEEMAMQIQREFSQFNIGEVSRNITQYFVTNY